MLNTLCGKLTDYIAAAPENRVQASYAIAPELVGLPLYDAPLLAVGDAADPAFAALKKAEAVGPWFRTPEEWLPGARRVISFFLPYSEAVTRSNYAGAEPSAMWLHGRIEGNAFLAQVSRWLQTRLEDAGYAAVVPALDSAMRIAEKPTEPGGMAYSSNWSERHVGWVCGLGTFGLSRGLITEKGMAGRIGSLITTAELPITTRPYTDLYEYCTHCGACIRRCPAGAISESGKVHEPCSDYLAETRQRYAPRYGCGKCQVKVPCMAGIPKKTDN